MPENKEGGALFRNKTKDAAHPSWPDYQGQGMISGVEYWFSGWIKDGKDGHKFLSLAFKPKEARADAPGATAPPQVDNGMPF